MTKQDEFMLLALEMAYGCIGNTSPNPSVGAVIVRDDRVISSGSTCEYGCNHAEIDAMEKVSGSLKGCEMYVTLEPCSHYGNTPPCSLSIIDSGIKKVYMPMLDPNPTVKGNGVKMLEDAGIEVVIMKKWAGAAADIVRQFHKYIINKKTFVIHKSAVTLDGRIASRTGDSKWISSKYSRYLVHRLRGKVDAVIIGKNTFLRDNPSLNVRLDDFNGEVRDYFFNNSLELNGRENFFISSLLNNDISGCRDPLRVVIGLPQEIDYKQKLFFDDNYLFYERKEKAESLLKNNKGIRTAYDKLNIKLIDKVGPVDEINFILEDLASRGILLAMLEGGGKLSGSFFDAGAIDQCLYFISPMIAGNGFPILEGTGFDNMKDSMPVYDVSSVMLENDILYTGYKNSAEGNIFEV